MKIKWKKVIEIGSVFLIGGFIIVLASVGLIKSQVQQVSGLAVAESNIKWNNLRDASAGDNLTEGIGAFNLYLYDGTNFDRARGDTTYGLDVDVTRMPAISGSKTPSDGYSNPTDHIGTWALIGMYNGSTWDMVRGDTTYGLDVDVTRTPSYSYSNIPLNTTIVIKSGAGFLKAITINKPGSGSTATVYDNTAGSGTIIATINTAASSPVTLTYEVAFSTGLTIVTAGTTAADITVSYK